MRVLVLACALSSGCALLANANAHHNSGGTACLQTPMFGVIDMLIAGGSAAIIANTETSWGWYTVPAVFGASGLLGTVSALRCGERSEVAENNAPPASNTAPSFGEAPVDPEAREATQEEMFGTQAGEPPKLIDRNGLPTKLPPVPLAPTTVPPTPPDPPATPKVPARLACKLEPRVECPEGYYCRLVAESAGECEKMP
jgi:hypothetical protein